MDHRGKTPKKLGVDFVKDGIPVASALLVNGGVLDLNAARCVTEDTHDKWMSTPTRRGDVLLTSEAPLGRVARITTDSPVVLGQRLFGLRGRKGILDSGYLFYALQSEAVQLDLQGRATGTTVVGIRQSALRHVRIPAPDLQEQRMIAEVLGALDDKIAANTKIAQTADDLAVASFHHAAFQSADLESVMRPLSDTAEFVNGKAFTKGASGSGRVVVRIAELNSGLGGSTVYSDAEVDEKHVARAGDILFAWSGSLTLHRWFRDAAIVNQHIFKVVPKTGYPVWLVYELIRQKLADFKGIAADKATTMGHIQRHHLDEAVLVPSDKELQRMDLGMTALWQRALLAEQESLSLAELRDTLLPELMSGRLRVKDAEAAASEAGL